MKPTLIRRLGEKLSFFKDDDFNNTYFLDLTSEVYTPGPDMSSERYGLSCNYISSTNEIIMVGGAKIAVNGSCGITYRKEVEILSLDSGTIRNGELKSKISPKKKI